MVKTLICKIFNLVPREDYDAMLRQEAKNTYQTIQKEVSATRRASRYYARLANIVKYVEQQRINKKVKAKIVDIADGRDNDGLLKNG